MGGWRIVDEDGWMKIGEGKWVDEDGLMKMGG